MLIELEAVGFVETQRQQMVDDYWGAQTARINLSSRFNAEALQGLLDFSHVEVLYYFHQVDPTKIVSGARHPRNNPAWPEVGIFAQRAKNRPNRIGSTICQLLALEGTSLILAELDAIDGTPILDIKPVMSEFLPRQAVRQPEWSQQLMSHYWSLPTS